MSVNTKTESSQTTQVAGYLSLVFPLLAGIAIMVWPLASIIFSVAGLILSRQVKKVIAAESLLYTIAGTAFVLSLISLAIPLMLFLFLFAVR